MVKDHDDNNCTVVIGRLSAVMDKVAIIKETLSDCFGQGCFPIQAI